MAPQAKGWLPGQAIRPADDQGSISAFSVETGFPSFRTSCLGLAAQLPDELGDIVVVRRQTRQALGIFAGRDQISGIAAEGDQRRQRLAILRMPGQAFLENRDG